MHYCRPEIGEDGATTQDIWDKTKKINNKKECEKDDYRWVTDGCVPGESSVNTIGTKNLCQKYKTDEAQCKEQDCNWLYTDPNAGTGGGGDEPHKPHGHEPHGHKPHKPHGHNKKDITDGGDNTKYEAAIGIVVIFLIISTIMYYRNHKG